jgi:DNA replication factor GINS
MYNELYEIWKRELETADLGRLPSDFYSRVADYLRRLREESRMLDKRTAKASLLRKEMQNVKLMIRGVIKTRYRKLVRKVVGGEKVPTEFLTSEEEKIYKGVSPFAEAFQSFARDILRGYVSDVGAEKQRRRIALRFLKDVPAIIGADMKTYGPFKTEDIASLPIENAKILTKQGLAANVEVTQQ